MLEGLNEQLNGGCVPILIADSSLLHTMYRLHIPAMLQLEHMRVNEYRLFAHENATIPPGGESIQAGRGGIMRIYKGKEEGKIHTLDTIHHCNANTTSNGTR